MKRRLLIGGLSLGLLLVLLAAAACGEDLQPRVDELESQVSGLEAEKADLAEHNETLKDITGPLPASLDSFFPPQCPGPGVPL